MGAIRWGGFSVPMQPEVIDRYVDAGLAVAPDEEARAWLLLLRAAAGLRWIAFHRPDPMPLEDRVRAGEAAFVKAQEIAEPALEANARRTVGALLIARGEVARGLVLTRPLLEIGSRIDDPRERHLMMIETLQTLAWIAGDGEALLPPLMDALHLGRELRAHDLCHSTGVLMSALYLSGRWDEIPGYLDEHIRTFNMDEADTTCPFALGAFQLGAAVLAHRGEIDRAREVSAEMPKSEAPVGIIEALQAMVANALGDPATGRSIAEQVLATGARNFAEEPTVEIVAELDALIALEDWDAVRAFIPVARSRSSELALAGPAIDRADGLAAAAAGDEVRGRGDARAGGSCASIRSPRSRPRERVRPARGDRSGGQEGSSRPPSPPMYALGAKPTPSASGRRCRPRPSRNAVFDNGCFSPRSRASSRPSGA